MTIDTVDGVYIDDVETIDRIKTIYNIKAINSVETHQKKETPPKTTDGWICMRSLAPLTHLPR